MTVTPDVTRPHPDPDIEAILDHLGGTVCFLARCGLGAYVIERVTQAVKVGEALGLPIASSDTEPGAGSSPEGAQDADGAAPSGERRWLQ